MARNRSGWFTMKISEPERTQLKELAEAAGLSMADYLRLRNASEHKALKGITSGSTQLDPSFFSEHKRSKP